MPVDGNYLYLAPDPNHLCEGNFWINPNIRISNSVFTIGQPATISLIVRNEGTTAAGTGSFGTARVIGAQAVVCALNTHPGFDPRLILPSLRHSGPLVWKNPGGGNYDLGTGQGTEPPSHSYIVLGPWAPTANDVDFYKHIPGVAFGLPSFLYPPGDLSTRDLHVCVYANCNGSVGKPPPDEPKDDEKDGDALADIAAWDKALAGGTSSFCVDRHHGQLNTTLARTLNKNLLTLQFYSGVPRQPKEGGDGMSIAKVFLREQVFEPRADQGLTEMIKCAGLDGLPIQPALVPARVAGIARFRSVAERIEQKAEEIVDEAREALEHLRGHWADEDDASDPGTPRNVLTVQLVPGELQPLLMKVAFDKDDPLGTVHVFDVIQLNQDGTRGGFRLATIQTPAEEG
jgi:hypothetical protein